MPATTTAHATNRLPSETLDAVVIGGAAGPNGAYMNADLAATDTNAVLAAAQRGITLA